MRSYGGIFRTYIVLLFISCARLFYFVDRFFFSIISCARLFFFYFVCRFFFSVISCARLFYFACRFLFSTISFARLFFLESYFTYQKACLTLENKSISGAHEIVERKKTTYKIKKVVRTRKKKRKNDLRNKKVVRTR